MSDDPGCRPEVMARLRAKMREPRARPRAQRPMFAVSGSGLPWLTRDLEIHKLKAEIQELRAEKSGLVAGIRAVGNALERQLQEYEEWKKRELPLLMEEINRDK
jgi:hypothetical protein